MIYDPNTDMTATQDVDVVEVKKPTISTNINKNLSTGSHLNFTLNTTYNRSSVSLLSSDDNITTLELTTTDTGPTPISINTYASPDSPSEFVTTGPGVSVDSVTGSTDPLPPGTYDLTLRSEHGTAVANDTTTITVDPRSTTDMTAYTTREAAPEGFENATAVRNAIADGTLTAAATATANDTLVYAVNATGLTGLPAAANASLERGADLDRLDGLSFGVTRTSTDDANGSVEGGSLGSTPNESAVHLDRDGLFLVADGETAFGTEPPPADGETFEAGFRVDDDRLRRADDGDHPVTTRVTYAATDSVDAHAENGSEGGPAATPPSEAEPAGSSGTGTSSESGTSGASGAPGGSGDPSGSGGTDGSDATGGSPGAGPSSSAGTGSAASGDGQGPSDGSRGSDGGRATPRPGVGITVAPGVSELPASAGPPQIFGPGRTDDGTGGPSAQGSSPADERSSGGGASATDSEAATGSTESVESPGAGDSPSDEDAASDLGYDDAPIRSTVYDLPGFGPVGSLAAVACASLLARCRARKP
ncbi:hypothetical protein GCM10009060_09850 [Halorubrum trapanicum]